MAAVLAVGGEGRAVASHLSAARLWGMLPMGPGHVDVCLLGRNGRSPQAGIRIHRSRSISDSELDRCRGVPVTPPARTLQDLRRAGPAPQAGAAARRALDLRLITDADLVGKIERSRSELERAFLRLCRDNHLPAPEMNVRVGRWEVDFLWREFSLIVETDGFAHHGNRLAFERDRARDAALQALGFRVLRFTYRQVTDEPMRVATAVRRVIGLAG